MVICITLIQPVSVPLADIHRCHVSAQQRELRLAEMFRVRGVNDISEDFRLAFSQRLGRREPLVSIDHSEVGFLSNGPFASCPLYPQ